MKFKYLGTAAAEGIPAMFCNCKICTEAKIIGGRNIRTRSQAIIDDKLLIDFPPDTYAHVVYGGLDLTRVYSCIVTHSHSDHLYSKDLGMRREGFAYLDVPKPLVMFGTQAVINNMQAVIDSFESENEKRVISKEIKPFENFETLDYTIIPLKANHNSTTGPVIYIIKKEEKCIFYANDTGYFPDETWAWLEINKPYFNFVSLDCTSGKRYSRDDHMCIEVNDEVKVRLEDIGCTDKKTIYCYNHISHNGAVNYDDLKKIADRKGFCVSYDGMKINI